MKESGHLILSAISMIYCLVVKVAKQASFKLVVISYLTTKEKTRAIKMLFINLEI